MGRRQDALEKVKNECQALRSSVTEDALLAVNADFTNVGDMIQVRDTLQKGV